MTAYLPALKSFPQKARLFFARKEAVTCILRPQVALWNAQCRLQRSHDTCIAYTSGEGQQTGLDPKVSRHKGMSRNNSSSNGHSMMPPTSTLASWVGERGEKTMMREERAPSTQGATVEGESAPSRPHAGRKNTPLLQLLIICCSVPYGANFYGACNTSFQS